MNLTKTETPEGKTGLYYQGVLDPLLGGPELSAVKARLPNFTDGYVGIKGSKETRARMLRLFQSYLIMAVLGAALYALDIEEQSGGNKEIMDKRRQVVRLISEEAVSCIGPDAQEFFRVDGNSNTDYYYRYYKLMVIEPRMAGEDDDGMLSLAGRFLAEFLLFISSGTEDKLEQARAYSLMEVRQGSPLLYAVGNIDVAFGMIRESCHR